MTRTRFIILFTFLIFAFNAQGTLKLDSLQSIWQNETESDSIRFQAISAYYDLNSFSDPDGTFVVTDYHLKLAQKKNLPHYIVKALLEKAKLFYVKGDYAKSMQKIDRALEEAPRLNNPQDLANIYYYKGNIYSEENKFQEAIRTYSIALKIYQEEHDLIGEAGTRNNIGILYQLIGNYDLALDYLEKSYNLFKKIDRMDVGGDILVNIADVKYEQGLYEQAITYGHQALSATKEKSNIVLIAEIYFSLAKSFKQLDNSDSASYYGNKSLSTDREINNESTINSRQIFLASLILETNVVEATKKGEAILQRLKPNDKKELKEAVYDLLYKCYKAQGMSDKALKMHELRTIYSDSIQQEKTNFSLIREAVKEEFEVKLLDHKEKNKKTNTKLKIGQFIIFGAAALLISLILLYFRKKSKKTRQEKQELLNELEALKRQNKTQSKKEKEDQNSEDTDVLLDTNEVQLNRSKLETAINRKLNETDWNVLNILLEDPVITNKAIAEKAFMSVDGIGSSLRRMYEYFEISETKYKKIALISKAIKISNG